jgi:hypothetical protein
MLGYVYLVWAKGTDMYKIGSSQYPEKRLPQLQTGSPVELELIATKAVESYEFEEKRLHVYWSQFRKQGEWFQFHPVMIPKVLDSFGLRDKWSLSQIEKAQSEAFDAAELAIKSAINDSAGDLRKYMDARSKCIFESMSDLLSEEDYRRVTRLIAERLSALKETLPLTYLTPCDTSTTTTP